MYYFCPVSILVILSLYIWRSNIPLLIILNKKEMYIIFSVKLRVFHLNIVKEYIVIYNYQCFMVDMSCRGDR